eukprot:TRINITY_DN32953_c0_g1_i1.p1 TRINITY_DN32953_c0_g1~~TRINITY_DN32953_c0_g1_i1.p1  ORF type:complete len:307 (-),score=27.76 TRINITY_DN32953_c0_g1_i1:71-991(-)
MTTKTSALIASSTVTSNTLCICEKHAIDVNFLSGRLLPASNSTDDLRRRCRECKVLLLLRQGLELDKYPYHTSIMGRRKQVLSLDEDGETLLFRPKRLSKSWSVSVSLSEIRGIVFGANTSTFKRLKASDVPPHWAAFSLICRRRTYDFSCSSSDVVESCVRGLQQVLWQRRPASPRGISPTFPWPLGLYLWMRLRLRLQDAACKSTLSVEHQLWIVFTSCSLKSSDELTKSRFMFMAGSLSEKYRFDYAKNTDLKDIHHKILFQRDRINDIDENRYASQIQCSLPRSGISCNIGMTLTQSNSSST